MTLEADDIGDLRVAAERARQAMGRLKRRSRRRRVKVSDRVRKAVRRR